MLEVNKIYQGDSLEVLKTFPNNSIDCIITSPPYYQLRDYNHPKQLGLESSVFEYIDKLLLILDECYRVLKKDGILYLNIADTYAGKDVVIDGITYIKRKSLMGVPLMLGNQLIRKGWILRNAIIWHKSNVIPYSGTDRFTNDYEIVYFFSKNAEYSFNQLKEPMVTKSKKETEKRVKTARKNNRLLDVNNSKNTPSSKYDGIKKQDASGIHTYVGFNDRYKAPADMMRNKRTVWSIPTESSKLNHFAMFPEALAKNLILSGSDEGGVVLDPFVGSGTTCAVAKKLNRNYIGIDLNSEYIEMANNRINGIVQDKGV